MKRTILIPLLLVMACRTAVAQEIIAIHPENENGRMLDFDEMYDPSLYPARSDFSFPRVRANEKWDAVCEGQSLYLVSQDGERKAVAVSESRDVTYGQSVSRHEFGIDDGVFWSPSGNRIAFYRKDESAVGEFPLLDITPRTGAIKSVRYPMAGTPSEHVSLGVFDLISGETVYMQVTDFTDERYLAGISWSPDDRYILIQVLDRSQHEMHMNMYRSSDGSFVRTVLTEKDEAWVEPTGPVEFLKGSWQFFYSTDNRDAVKAVYLCDTLGTVRLVTPDGSDSEYVGNDGCSLFYTSRTLSPAENALFRIDIGKRKVGKPVCLTPAGGWHDIRADSLCSSFIDRWQDWNNPGRTVIIDRNGKTIRTLAESEDPLAGIRTGEIRFGTVKSADGLYNNNFRLFLPAGFDPAKKYPVVVYVYGGPHSQMVRAGWLGGLRMWEIVLAQRGYVVYVQDGRGTDGHGTAYRKSINRRCGVAEMEDQMEGVRMLKSLPFVDEDRIGVSGWSYGGFMTVSLMTTHPDVFKVGACGGPVIDWKWYEVMYGERYMDTPQSNPDGFTSTSLMGKSSCLKGKLLIMQGMMDDTVLPINSLSFVQECVQNGVQVDFFPYPVSEHNVKTSWRGHMYEKMTGYFDDNL